MVFSITRKRLHHNHEQDGNQAPDPKKRNKRCLILLLIILLISNLILFNRLIKSRQTIIRQHQVLLNVQEPPDASSEISGRWYGLCAKNSIHSIQDFKDIVENDSLLAEHFSDFNWNNARMGALEAAAWTHLAYRKDDRIATGRRVIRLPKDDGFITDGKRWLRTYCCNDFVLAAPEEAAAAPDTVTGPGGNPDAELDQLVKKLGPMPDVNSLAAGPDRLLIRSQSITVVPEPSPLLLIGSGLSILVLMARHQRRVKVTKSR